MIISLFKSVLKKKLGQPNLYTCPKFLKVQNHNPNLHIQVCTPYPCLYLAIIVHANYGDRIVG